jgi:hypothetical protein
MLGRSLRNSVRTSGSSSGVGLVVGSVVEVVEVVVGSVGVGERVPVVGWLVVGLDLVGVPGAPGDVGAGEASGAGVHAVNATATARLAMSGTSPARCGDSMAPSLP